MYRRVWIAFALLEKSGALHERPEVVECDAPIYL
jgi:hypothetical protein